MNSFGEKVFTAILSSTLDFLKEAVAEIDALEKEVLAIAEENGFSPIARAHLTYNHQEFTLFFEKISCGGPYTSSSLKFEG